MPLHPNTDNFIPESYYHLFNHAVGSDNLFRNEANYLYFLNKLKQYILPVCKIYSYCLMPNHFHFLIKIRTEEELMDFYLIDKPNSDFSNVDYHKIVMRQFSRFFNGYAQAYNKMYHRKGALFVDYLKRKQVLNDAYLSQLIYYIHFNPIRHKFCKSLDEWTYSSFHSILSNKNTLIERDDIIKWFGSKEIYKEVHSRNSEWLNEFEMIFEN